MGDLILEVKQPGNVDFYPPASHAEVKNVWSISTTPYVFMAQYIISHRECHLDGMVLD
jgi:hypothetical protein